ncbi:MAG: class I fructose-bisphosphate aldolase [Candidatus Kariarchaeaceae archaeon]|jgi:predicted phospho-2-dehydro-3-deoxyheptonate aldolase
MKLGVGKAIRYRRLVDPSGAIIAVPMDHGYTLGPIPGLDTPLKTTERVFAGGASCVIVHKGLVRTIAPAIPKEKGLVVHISGSTFRSPNPNLKIQTGSVETAVRLGADGISCHINVGTESDYEMLTDLAELTDEAELAGIPLMAMMYARGDDGVDNNDPAALAHVARVAEESGADIVKINSTLAGDKFDEVTQGINIPIVVAGGSKSSNFDSLLNTIRKCMLAGASGVSVGRNVFQSANPQLAMEKIRKVVSEAILETETNANIS